MKIIMFSSVNLHITWNEISQQATEKCWRNLFHNEDEFEHDVPLRALKEQSC